MFTRLITGLVVAWPWSLGTIATAPAEELRVGQQVYLKRDAEIRFGNDDVRDKQSSPATIRKIRGDWVQVEAGWMRREFAVPAEEALWYFTQEIRRRRDAQSYVARANVWRAKHDWPKAIDDLDEAIRLRPDYANAFNNRGSIWMLQKDYETAIADFSEAIHLKPNYLFAYYNRGAAHFDRGEYDAALRDMSEAIRLSPTYVLAYSQRGQCWFRKYEPDKALADFDQVVRLAPNSPDGYMWRSWTRATHPNEEVRDGALAVADAKVACELTGYREDGPLDALAAASAEAGDFAAAVRWEEAALAASPEGNSKGAMEERLQLFRAGKPYRNGPPKP